MQFNPVLKKVAFFFVSSFFLFAGCKKGATNTLSDADDNGGYASDASKIEWLNNDAISIVDAAGNYYNGVYMRHGDRTTTNPFGTCATVSTDTLSSPHVLIIRFGDLNCQCLDGKNRRGTIMVSYDSTYTDSQQIHTITFQNYYVDDQQFTGNIKVTRIDTTVVGDWYYKETINDTLVTAPNQFITWKGALVRKWLSGFNTGDRSDDVYSISGDSKLTRANGHFFDFAIQTPLQVALNCDYIESGVVTVTGYNGVRTLNYATSSGATMGGCDNDALLYIGAAVYQIKL